MGSQIQRTIELMKRCYDQPMLFHILHNHLSQLLEKTTPACEVRDDWSRILIFSSHPNKMPNQGLETKIQGLMHKLKMHADTEENRLRLMCICYYLLNRPPHLINHIVTFELVNSFLGKVSDYFDGLIIKILSSLVLAKVFCVDENRKMRKDALDRMLCILKERTLSDQNRVRALACFVSSSVAPAPVNFVEILPNYQGYKYLETICMYAKYAVDAASIKSILPSYPGFVDGLRDFMNCSLAFECRSGFDLKCSMVQDRTVFARIRDAFERAQDKQKLVAELLDFIMSLR